MEHDDKIPFMLFEPAKTEYRSFKAFKSHPDPHIVRLAKDLQVYTPGNEKVSPLRLNPLEIISGIDRDEHIENVLACFSAAMPMSGPLPALLGEALEKVYEDYPNPEFPPMMTDLVKAANDVLATKGYSRETNSDIRAALEVRIGILTRRNLGRVFQCRHSVPTIEHLMTVPSVIELARIPQQGCLLTLFQLMRVREYLQVYPPQTNELRYMILFEEAHNIVGASSDARPSEDNPDPGAFATEYVCRMLAELRALGVGIVIIDQLPSNVAPEVIKNTGSKLAFRQVANQDREELGGTMLFGDTEMEDIARLATGEAFFSTEGYYGPCRIKSINLHELVDLSIQLTDARLRSYLEKDKWFIDAAKKRTRTELDQLKVAMDSFDDQRMAVIHRAKAILTCRNSILDQAEDRRNKQRLTDLLREIRVLRKGLLSAKNAFERGLYRNYLPTQNLVKIIGRDIKTYASSLVHRFESVIEPDTNALLEYLDSMVRNFMSKKHKEFHNAKKK